MKIEPDLRLYKEVEITDLYDLFFSEINHDLMDFGNRLLRLKENYSDFINLYIHVEQDYDYTGFKLMGFIKKTKEEIEKDQKEEIEKSKNKQLQKEIKRKKLLKELENLDKEKE